MQKSTGDLLNMNIKRRVVLQAERMFQHKFQLIMKVGAGKIGTTETTKNPNPNLALFFAFRYKLLNSTIRAFKC